LLKIEQLEASRVKNILLTNKLKILEQEHKLKENMTEGLSLIDFEQLKIDNQIINERMSKVEDEITKIKHKRTLATQVLMIIIFNTYICYSSKIFIGFHTFARKVLLFG
jgi:histone deacetylase 6